jgi:hypothetical protein
LAESQPVDPRQAWLFDGPHSLRQQAERACDELDAPGLRKAQRLARERYPAWPGARPWNLWADGIDHLLGHEQGQKEGLAPLGAAELARRALSLSGMQARRHFPEMSAGRLHRVRSLALCRAAAQILADEEAASRLLAEEGWPVGYLHLVAGVPEQAVLSLRLQGQKLRPGRPGQGRLLGYLGEALWRCERTGEALLAYRDAYLCDPFSVDEKEMTCRPAMDLLDACADLDLPGDARGWLPVVGDLLGQVPLSGCPLLLSYAGAATSLAQRGAALLFAYRRSKAEGEEAERLERKRELLKLAPGLKELLRGL